MGGWGLSDSQMGCIHIRDSSMQGNDKRSHTCACSNAARVCDLAVSRLNLFDHVPTVSPIDRNIEYNGVRLQLSRGNSSQVLPRLTSKHLTCFASDELRGFVYLCYCQTQPVQAALRMGWRKADIWPANDPSSLRRSDAALLGFPTFTRGRLNHVDRRR